MKPQSSRLDVMSEVRASIVNIRNEFGAVRTDGWQVSADPRRLKRWLPPPISFQSEPHFEIVQQIVSDFLGL